MFTFSRKRKYVCDRNCKISRTILRMRKIHRLYFLMGLQDLTLHPARFIMTPSLSIQLGLMYGKNTDQDLEVILIDTQKQSNGVDCGLFAIAHLTEFCIKDVLNPKAGFDTKKMRTHL